MTQLIVAGLLVLFSLTDAHAQRHDGMNEYILRTVETLYNQRKGGGYDLHKAFTQDLKYGDECCVKASSPPLTMCVAGVTETLIETLNFYSKETKDKSVFKMIPISSWRSGSRASIRPYIFMYKGVVSNGTADAFRQFGIGKEVSFDELKPGDVINFNRTSGSGHSVIFIEFIARDYSRVDTIGPRVAGFKYFSAQGAHSPDAGFAYRWAFFDGFCPEKVANKPRDCTIIRSKNQKLLNTGYMLRPRYWNTDAAAQNIANSARRSLYRELTGFDLTVQEIDSIMRSNPSTPQISATDALQSIVPETYRLNFDGVTTD